MTNGSHDSATAVPDAVTVGIFAPADAEGIVQLFRAVYGEGYPIRLFYDAQAIIAANETGEYCGVVARTPSGEVVGVEHLFPSTPYPALLEAGVGLVRKDFRGAGINRRLLGFLYEEYAPQHPEIEEVYGEAVCYHTHMQRAVLEYRHVETAVQVALMPAETYALEKESSSRVATLDLFRCYRPKPHTVFLPHAYEEVLRWTYGRLDDARALEPSREQVPKDARTAAEMTVFDYAGVARIAVGAAGEDLAARLADLERQALDALEAQHRESERIGAVRRAGGEDALAAGLAARRQHLGPPRLVQVEPVDHPDARPAFQVFEGMLEVTAGQQLDAAGDARGGLRLPRGVDPARTLR